MDADQDQAPGTNESPRIGESYEEFISEMEDKHGGSGAIEQIMAALASAAVMYVSGKYQIDPELLASAVTATAIGIPVSVRLAFNYRHYRKTGERRPLLREHERIYVRRAVQTLALILDKLGIRLNRPRLRTMAKALLIAIGLAVAPPHIHVDPFIVAPKEPIQIKITGAMSKPAWSSYTMSAKASMEINSL